MAETGSFLESVATYGQSYDIKTYLRHDGVEMPTGATAYLNCHFPQAFEMPVLRLLKVDDAAVNESLGSGSSLFEEAVEDCLRRGG